MGKKGWRRTLSVVTPEVAMMIDTSLNVDDDSLVAGIVSFLLYFYFCSRISFLLLKTVGGATRSRLTSSTRENECTFLSSVRVAGVTQCRDAPYRKRRWYGTVKGMSNVDT